MSLPTATPSDFKGSIKISTNSSTYSDERLNEYIEEFLPLRLKEVLGGKAFVTIRDNDDGADTRWVELLDGVDYLDSEGDTFHYDGLMYSLLRLIYFDFIRNDFKPAQDGLVKQTSETSENLSGDQIGAIVLNRYNTAVRYLKVQTVDFLQAKEDVYPEIQYNSLDFATI